MERKRFMISMSEEDVNCFEAGREAAGMNKSAYIRLLIAEHEKRVPRIHKVQGHNQGNSRYQYADQRSYFNKRYKMRIKWYCLNAWT